MRQMFYKMMFTAYRSPEKQIQIFYKGRPLFAPAMLQNDRYVFPLPVNLAEKMMAGGLVADFGFADANGRKIKAGDSPTSIMLYERYS